MKTQKNATAMVKYEYGCDLRRLFPSGEFDDPLYWGAAIASVRPGEQTDHHAHDEMEMFLVMEGAGVMHIEDESEVLQRGDVVLIPRNSNHWFKNMSEDVALLFLTMYWDSPQARENVVAYIESLKEAQG